jgi:predicted AAA+ superfamily ATPase
MSAIFRNITASLLDWKQSAGRKPLVLRGARQVGKSYALEQFGQTHFAQYHVVNFQENPSVHGLFDKALSPADILQGLEFALDRSINTERDLLIFDEIQDCPRALTSLKYFCEQMPQLALCCAGSLLGVVQGRSPFPVGKVNFLDLYPLSFQEFLGALDEQRALSYLQGLHQGSHIPAPLHEQLLDLLKEYWIVGGMPEVVDTYRHQRTQRKAAFANVRARQQDLLDAYVRDFAKYAESARADRILAVLNNLPAQLARENKKFQPSKVISGGRYANLQSAIDWLSGAGLVIKVPIANAAELPFSAFTQENRFKLYFFDTGLLGALARLSPATLYTGNDLFATFKGAFCENYVAQELHQATGQPLVSWANNTAEIEFILEKAGHILPIEVKSGASGKLKSLNVFMQKYPATLYRTRLSTRPLEINQAAAMHSYPLYLAGQFPLPTHASG